MNHVIDRLAAALPASLLIAGSVLAYHGITTLAEQLRFDIFTLVAMPALTEIAGLPILVGEIALGGFLVGIGLLRAITARPSATATTASVEG